MQVPEYDLVSASCSAYTSLKLIFEDGEAAQGDNQVCCSAYVLTRKMLI